MALTPEDIDTGWPEALKAEFESLSHRAAMAKEEVTNIDIYTVHKNNNTIYMYIYIANFRIDSCTKGCRDKDSNRDSAVDVRVRRRRYRARSALLLADGDI